MKDRAKTIKQLVDRLGFQWQDKHLLETALTHTSFANENRSAKVEHNQRLEFLGDAVLELIISNYVYQAFPKYPEGLLTKVRAAVVCEPSLAKVANDLGLGQCLLMGKGEERTGGRSRPSILADAFESVVGAIFLDQGLEQVTKFVLSFLVPLVENYAYTGGHIGDYKSELQEVVQQKSDNLITYVVLNEEGPDHNKVFTAGVKYGEEFWGQGRGKTKKEAEQAAAKAALIKLAAGKKSAQHKDES